MREPEGAIIQVPQERKGEGDGGLVNGVKMERHKSWPFDSKKDVEEMISELVDRKEKRSEL